MTFVSQLSIPVMQEVLLHDSMILGGDVFLHLVDLVVHAAELSLQSLNLLLRVDKLLGEQITVRAYGLIQRLFLLELHLICGDLLVELMYLKIKKQKKLGIVNEINRLQ